MSLQVAQLIEIAYRYHPRLGDPAEVPPGGLDERWEAAPESRALRARQREANEAHDEWRACLAHIQGQLPGCVVHDHTRLEYEACYSGGMFLRESKGRSVEKTVLVYASVLAPVYLLYELHHRRPEGKFQVVDRRDEPTTDIAPIFAVALSALRARWPALQRMSLAMAAHPVPDLYLTHGAANLGDALFSPHRW